MSQAQRIRNTTWGDLFPWLALTVGCALGIGMTLFWISHLVP